VAFLLYNEEILSHHNQEVNLETMMKISTGYP